MSQYSIAKSTIKSFTPQIHRLSYLQTVLAFLFNEFPPWNCSKHICNDHFSCIFPIKCTIRSTAFNGLRPQWQGKSIHLAKKWSCISGWLLTIAIVFAHIHHIHRSDKRLSISCPQNSLTLKKMPKKKNAADVCSLSSIDSPVYAYGLCFMFHCFSHLLFVYCFSRFSLLTCRRCVCVLAIVHNTVPGKKGHIFGRNICYAKRAWNKRKKQHK